MPQPKPSGHGSCSSAASAAAGSYDLLDNGGAPSADRILPEYQILKVGDIVKAMPKGDFGFPVAVIRLGEALVLAGTLDTRTG